MATALLRLWQVLLLLAVLGCYTKDFFRVALALSLMAVLYDRCSRKGKGHLLEDFMTQTRVRISGPVVTIIVGSASLATIGAFVLNFAALVAPLWDLGVFIQATFAQATHGVPEFSFTGEKFNYHFIHRSLSLHALGWLYRIFHHPWVVLVWEGIFLVLPGFVCMLWYRAVFMKFNLRREPIGYFLAFLCYAATPTVLLQGHWTYAFHTASMTFLALAYLFYFQKQWAWWSLALLALAFEKEEFGFVTATFALMVFAELLWQRKWRANWGAILISWLTAVKGISSYCLFERRYPDFASFSKVYGYLGATPAIAAMKLLTHPGILLAALIRPEVLSYLLFFVVTSFLWLKPRASSFKYFVPVLPLLALNCLAPDGKMHLLREHYTLPIVVGLAAVRIFGVLHDLLDQPSVSPRPVALQDYRSLAAYMLLALLPLAWDHESSFRTLHKAYLSFQESQTDRQLIAEAREDHENLICCEGDFCTPLIDRDNILEAKACAKGSLALNNYVGKKARYLVSDRTKFDTIAPNGLARVSFPEKWPDVSRRLKLSDPIPVTF